jgi:HAE1 family hydrophobic/amphiphilic exporter-1
MSWFTKWAFKNKAAVSIMSILVLIMGLISYLTLPMEFLPSADQPLVTVVVMGQGTDSKAMESDVTTPIESSLSGVKGKTNIFSTTGDGYSKIDISYDSKTDMKAAKQEVQDALSKIQLPQNVSKPTVVQLNTSMISIAEIALTFNDGLTPKNLELAQKKIIPSFKDIKGISTLQTIGPPASYVSVKVNNSLMAQKQVSLQSILESLQGQNNAVAVGEKTIDGKTSNIKVVGNIDSISKVENVTVAPGVALKDIATVSLEKPMDTLTRINGKEGLILVIAKDGNSNAVSVTKNIRDTVSEMNKKYKQSQSAIVIATADMVENSVQSMMKEVLLGAFFATIVIMLFLRNIRSTFITIISIPLSLALTLFLLSRSGVTLNILTLGGVAVAVGRLVDDSIVVIENIFRKMQNEKFSVQLVIDATKEVSRAITASTLTTVAVFLPIGFVNGSLQDFVLPFALTITYSLLASLMVALAVVPLMSSALLGRAKLHEHTPSVKFKKLLTWSLNHKWVVLTLSFVLFVGSIGVYSVMPKGAVDNSSADFIQVYLDYPNETPLETVTAGTLKLEKFILAQKEVKDVGTTLGNSADAIQYGAVDSPTKSSISIVLKDKKDTDRIVKKITDQKDSYPDADLTAGASSLMGSGSPQIKIDIVGDQLDQLTATSGKITNAIKNISGIEKISTNEEKTKTVYSFEVDPAKGNPQQLAQQLGVMLNKTPLGTININNQKTTVFLDSMLDPKSPDDLKNIPIMTPTGMAPVSTIATLSQQEKPTTQYHKDGNPYVEIVASVDANKLSDVTTEINKKIFGDKQKIKPIKLPNSVNVVIGGASTQQSSDFTDLFTTMAMSIGIVFLIMVITFKTIRAPISILFSLPLAAVGAILGLLISRITVDLTALLGALMLIGIVVTNAIVLLDRVKHNEQNMIIRDAIVEAASIRMRPILMTAIATISAMLPLLFKKAETGNLVSQSLAIVVIGGLTVATLLTLVVIPVVYELFHFKKSKKQRLKRQAENNLSV